MEIASGQTPFTPEAKKAPELALREALSLGHNYIGTEHILLALVRVDEGLAARVLLDRPADSERIRNEVIRLLAGVRGSEGSGGEGSPEGIEAQSDEALAAAGKRTFPTAALFPTKSSKS